MKKFIDSHLENLLSTTYSEDKISLSSLEEILEKYKDYNKENMYFKLEEVSGYEYGDPSDIILQLVYQGEESDEEYEIRLLKEKQEERNRLKRIEEKEKEELLRLKQKYESNGDK